MIAIGPPSRAPLLDPGHLDALELTLARRLRIVGESRQLAHPTMEVGEADGDRIDVRMGGVERLRDVLGVVPSDLHRQISSRRRFASASWSERSMIRRANGSVAWLSASTASWIATWSSPAR